MPLGIVQLLYIPCYFFDLKNNTNKPNVHVLSSRKSLRSPSEGIGNSLGSNGLKDKKKLKEMMRLNWNFHG